MYQLDKGIFLEDKNTLLEWGRPLNQLSKEHGGEVINKVDRLIINWGIHKILSGLELDLSIVILGTPNFLLHNKFTTISAWVVGDLQAKDFFNKSSSHLISLFGEPEKEDLKNESEAFWIWHLDDADIILNLYEQHCFKTCLTIDQNL